MCNKEAVIAAVESIALPTYAEPDPVNWPIFAENRVHQRTSGKVYPCKVVAAVGRAPAVTKTYRAIRLENEYIEIIILPQLGGRIYSAKDKRTGLDIFYRQHVIKPALIGLLGSWVSGGMEFNWPSHHRPSTFMPADWEIRRSRDGSATVWLSENDPMERMKGMLGVRLRPGELIFDTLMQVCNRTPTAKSFLWWENAAIPITKDFELFFPDDVDHVHFHYKRSVTRFPMARGLFNGINFAKETDIRLHKNTRRATSFFSAPSRHDFFGGYDHERKAGVVHIADHTTSPGKKMFTWAYSPLSKTWEKALTDTDGQYVELMAGSYSGNQPDFAWLEGYETKCFTQSWYPIAKTGVPVYANENAAVFVADKAAGELLIQGVRSYPQAELAVRAADGQTIAQCVALAPGAPTAVRLKLALPEFYRLTITSQEDGCILEYEKRPAAQAPLPPAFVELPGVDNKLSAAQLYQCGVHIEQYRDPILSALPYYEKSIEKAPDFEPAHLALANYYYKHFEFEKALSQANQAVQLQTRFNNHPRDTEAYYIRGLAHMALRQREAAKADFEQASWSYKHHSSALTMLAELYGCEERWNQMAKYSALALEADRYNPLAGVLLAGAQHCLGQTSKALDTLEQVLERDVLNQGALALRALINNHVGEYIQGLLCDPSQLLLDVAFDLANGGLYSQAYELLHGLADLAPAAPMVFYTMACLAQKLGIPPRPWADKAAGADESNFFPIRREELAVLDAITAGYPQDANAHYLRGCQLYDKGRAEAAFAAFTKAVSVNPGHAGALRGLACLHYTCWNNRREAYALMRKVTGLCRNDDQLIWETLHIMAKLNVPPRERIKFIAEQTGQQETSIDTGRLRDDICLELARAFTMDGRPEEALAALSGHEFVPCEGGEHLVAEQYMAAEFMLGRLAFRQGGYIAAIRHFKAAQSLPSNLNTGLWNEVMLVPYRYYEALSYMKLGDVTTARRFADDICGIPREYFSLMYLPSLPVYQFAMHRLFDEAREAEQLRSNCQSLWEAALHESRPGYFKATPLFMSFIDNPEEARQAHFSYLLGLLEQIAGTDDSGWMHIACDKDPSNLYAFIQQEFGC